MAAIADISQALGDYMLKGWVLTDQSCPTLGCSVPLLRSPRGKTPVTTFCVKCNDIEKPPEQPEVRLDASTGSLDSPISTPPTEFSLAPGSPVFIPLEETEQSRRRREQSDRASSEIGKKLLKGWAMLGDECPSDTCYGVPLVRPPKSAPEPDPRKECVICGNIYITEVDWAGREKLVPLKSETSDQYTSTQSQAGNSSQSQYLPSPPKSHVPFSSPFGRQPTEEQHSKNFAGTNMPASVPSDIPKFKATTTSEPSSSTMVLDETSQTLQTSLQSLSGRLSELSSQSILDPISIGATADAINKVALAFGQIRRLQSDQNQ